MATAKKEQNLLKDGTKLAWDKFIRFETGQGGFKVPVKAGVPTLRLTKASVGMYSMFQGGDREVKAMVFINLNDGEMIVQENEMGKALRSNKTNTKHDYWSGALLKKLTEAGFKVGQNYEATQGRFQNRKCWFVSAK